VQFQREDGRFQLRFMAGERMLGPLLEWLGRENVGYASLTGLGAVSTATVSYWNAETQQYETHELTEQMEVVSLIGNVTLRDGEPFVHAHVALGRRDLSLVGGHLNDLSVHPTLEISLVPGPQPVHRALDESCGLYVMHLGEQA
jgi:predicted DNA-binding protein with PD1-like motif